MPARRRSGFTLIELLVVIAIIAILAAILFPVFARAREAARKSNCSNNMKECAIALQTYWTDYDATLPSSAVTFLSITPTGTPAWSDTNFATFATTVGTIPVPSTASPQTWVQMLYSHMRSRDLMFCPSDNVDHFAVNAKVSYQWKYAIDRAWWGTGTAADDVLKCQKESDFGYNSDQIFLWERAGFHDNKSTGVQNDTRINVAYLDTHVRNVTLVNSAPKPPADPVDTAATSIAQGEPWYFNYNQDSVKALDVNPPATTLTPSTKLYLDPRKCSDLLP